MTNDSSFSGSRSGRYSSAVCGDGDCEAAENLCSRDVNGAPVWKVDPERPKAESLHAVHRLLSRGGVIIYPTETSYGLGGNPTMGTVVERIYNIKGRESGKPLPLIASDLQAVHEAVAGWPATAERLAKAFWPGPLTLVLPAASHLLPQIHAATGKIGIRISSHPVSRALAAGVGGLIIATSANKAHERAFQTPSEIPGTFLSLVDGLVDAGPSPGDCRGLPSTIVDACTSPPRLIRAGCIPWERVVQAIG